MRRSLTDRSAGGLGFSQQPPMLSGSHVSRLIIIADDVTGAADSASRCRQAGLPSTIYLGNVQNPLPLGAISFSSDSRHLPAHEAAERVRSLVAPMVSMADVIWYKKIDSTLRGNLGAELDAMLGALAWQGEIPCAVISPAFPAQGRGLEDGYLVYAGTSYHSICLSELLHAQSDHVVGALPLCLVREGVSVVATEMAELQAAGVKLLVADALSDEDLCTVMLAAQRALPQRLFCGSAGMVGLLAETIVQAQGMGGGLNLPDQPPVRWGDAVVAVVGSGSAMAHTQIQYVREQRRAHVIEVDMGTEGFCQSVDDRRPRTWLLHLPRPSDGTPLEGEPARAMVAHLSHRACELIERLDAAFLILVGGDTAVHVLDCLGVEQLTVIEELLPGVPLTVGTGGNGMRRNIVLKAGNHGDEGTLDTMLEIPEKLFLP